MNWWPSGRVSASVYCGCWFDLQWWRSWCALLMRLNNNKQLFSTPYVAFRCWLDSLVMVISNIVYIYIYPFPSARGPF